MSTKTYRIKGFFRVGSKRKFGINLIVYRSRSERTESVSHPNIGGTWKRLVMSNEENVQKTQYILSLLVQSKSP